jgi:phage host-nuclease inhibitor protein Gam
MVDLCLACLSHTTQNLVDNIGQHMTKQREKVYAPKTKEECVEDIKKLGDHLRNHAREVASMNDEIGEITERYSGKLESLLLEINILKKGIEIWVTEHRDELTDNRKVKTVNLITGEVSWHNRPPSVSISRSMKISTLIDTLKSLSLDRFIRTAEEIKKEAILAEPDAIKGVKGIRVNRDIEDFSITPFEQDVRNAN